MKYKITVFSKEGVSDTLGVLKTIGDAFKCEFEVINKKFTKKKELSHEELELCKKSDAVIMDVEAPKKKEEGLKNQLGVMASYSETEYGAFFENVLSEEDLNGTPEEKKELASILSMAMMLDYLKLNDAAKLLRQGVDSVVKTGGKIHHSNKKLSESISVYVKNRLSARSFTSRQQSYGEVLFSFGGVMDD